MQNIKRLYIDRLLADPLAYASMMESDELEDVIVAFVSVLINRKCPGGGQN